MAAANPRWNASSARLVGSPETGDQMLVSKKIFFISKVAYANKQGPKKIYTYVDDFLASFFSILKTKLVPVLCSPFPIF
jgi:hypothetical protein